MSLTERQLNRATLDRQMLLRRESMEVVDAVRRLVALQAQEPASPYLALWNRLADFDPAELDSLSPTARWSRRRWYASRCTPCTPRIGRRSTTRWCPSYGLRG